MKKQWFWIVFLLFIGWSWLGAEEGEGKKTAKKSEAKRKISKNFPGRLSRYIHRAQQEFLKRMFEVWKNRHPKGWQSITKDRERLKKLREKLGYDKFFMPFSKPF